MTHTSVYEMCTANCHGSVYGIYDQTLTADYNVARNFLLECVCSSEQSNLRLYSLNGNFAANLENIL